MHLLFVTTEFPWPPTSGGSVRTISQLRVLASLSEVRCISVACVSEQDVSHDQIDGLRATVPKVDVLPPVFHPVHLFDFKRYVPRVVALRVFAGVPYLAAKWDSPPFRKVIHSRLRFAQAGCVYIDHLGMARYLPFLRRMAPGARFVLDQHNVESDFFRQFARKQRGIRRFVACNEAALSEQFEADALRGVDAVSAISREDAARFASVCNTPVHVVPMVLSAERVVRARPEQPHYCYLGNLRWHPNVAGINWLCREVWPRIRARLPQATLSIAGVGLRRDSSGAWSVPDAWRVPGVETLGFVEDLEPLYARSVAMLAPVEGGSGVRMKLLEGFRAGIPVVTTPDGASGLPLTDGSQLLVAGDAEAFADRVVRLWNDAELGNQLVSGAYAFLEEHHSLSAAQCVMRQVLGLA